MPIYEYECSGCHQHFDLMQKISEPPLVQCPSCSKDLLVKLVSPAGFHLKGTGWYATDFKNSTSSTTASKSAQNNKASKATASVSKESKPTTNKTGEA